MRYIIMSAGVAMLLAGGPATAQQNGTSLLDGGFEKWDKNKDGFLNAVELTRAFRGPNAKAVTHKPGDNPKADVGTRITSSSTPGMRTGTGRLVGLSSTSTRQRSSPTCG